MKTVSQKNRLKKWFACRGTCPLCNHYAKGLQATEDKSIAPEIQRSMYKRSNTKVTEVKGSHVIYMSQPDAVAKVIIEAAVNASKGIKPQ